VDYFCEAKPQNGDLQTVEHTKCAVLERLVMNARCGSGIERRTEAKPWHPDKNLAADIRSIPSYWQASLRSLFSTN